MKLSKLIQELQIEFLQKGDVDVKVFQNARRNKVDAVKAVTPYYNDPEGKTINAIVIE